MPNLEELPALPWPQAFWEWKRSECERWSNIEFEVIEAGWFLNEFSARVMLNRREVHFVYRPSEWDAGLRERETAGGLKHG